MNDQSNIPHINDSGIPETAVSVYGQGEPLEDFPVLKAFQQYVDAEQAKARKRILMISAFFAVLMIVVICAFVAMLISISNRNQLLNDRMIELAMRDRDRSAGGSSVVVQSPQDSAAILALTAKMDEMQKKLVEDQAKAEKAAAEAAEEAKQAAIEAARPKKPTADQVEIKRLKALLAAEKEKASAERERQRQEEIEAYRRRYYPELYEDEDEVYVRPVRKRRSVAKKPSRTYDSLDDENAISYFDDADVEDDAAEDDIKIPVEVKTSTGSGWTIPED